MQAVFRFLLIIIFSFSVIEALPARQLKKTDIRPTMDEFFTYHVEQKQLTPIIVKRSFKLYIEYFDFAKTYLLQSEVKPFLELSDQKISHITTGFNQNNFAEYENLNQLISKAVLRARKIRQELKNAAFSENAAKDESYASYAETQDELKQRLSNQFSRFLAQEKPSGDLTQEKRNKIFALWEKRLNRFENGYLQENKAEHYFTLHLLKAMAKSLDAHTAYYSPEEAFELRTALEKQFEGLGVVLKEGIDGVVITGLIKGGPAEKSGKIQPGDLLVAVNKKSVEGIAYEEVLERLKGNGQDEILLDLKRTASSGKEELLQVGLRREKIVMDDERVKFSSIPYGDGIIGKIDLPSFYESGDGSSCEMDLREALKGLKKQGNVMGLVLDMRENSGGFLNQAVKVAGLFITSGVIVISKYAEGEIQYLRAVDGRSYYNGPLVILTSKASASAAEIVAQALQDYGTALVVGDERTYGKGSIQYQTVTEKTAKVFFKVTVGRYYTVSGKSTQIEGVKADIVVPTIYAPYRIGEKYLEYPLSSDRMPPAFIDTLSDVDGHSKQWFQKNYLPYLHKRDSSWRKMLPTLKENSAYRLEHDKDFSLYLKYLDNPESVKEKKWGEEDLQMIEAVNIVQDMILIKTEHPAYAQ